MEIQGTYRHSNISDSNETCNICDISDNTDRSDSFESSAIGDSRYQEIYKCWNAGALF